MDETTRNKLIKATGDACGGLAAESVGLAILVMTLSFKVSFYQIEMWSVVSIAVGIALGSLFTRLSLFLSNFKEHKPKDVLNPVLIWLVAFTAVGVVMGYVLSELYNAPYPNEMCFEIANGVIVGHSEETIQRCYDYRSDIHLLLNGTLAVYVISMMVWFVGRVTYAVSRFGRDG